MNVPGNLPNAAAMRQLLLGRLMSSALHAAVVLRIPEVVPEQPYTATGLANHLGVNEQALRRLLRVLADLGVIVNADGVLSLTEFGRTLREDATGSARHTALLVGGEIGRSWDDLPHAVRTGEPAFNAAFGVDLFGYLDDAPDLQTVFYRSQAADLEVTLAELAVVGFSSYRTVVDVGGGDGALLEHVLLTCPEARGVLLETESVAERARNRMASAGLSDRCEVLVGDFFDRVPAGGDLYVLRDILHDWPDEQCSALLRLCREAMPLSATLLVVERAAASDDDADLLNDLMDLYMLTVVGGRERTRDELERLVEDAGFVVGDRHRLTGGAAAIEASPVRHDRPVG